jgi:small subunit ribosomal protein S1
MYSFFNLNSKKIKISEILAKYNYQVKIGDILAGEIIGVEKKNLLVDLGLKRAAFLPNKEIKIKNLNPTLPLPKFNEFLITAYNFQTNQGIVSLRRVHYMVLWERFKQIDYNNIILFTKFYKSIRRGKLAKFDSLNTFIPNFHLPKHYRRKKKTNQFLSIKILEVRNRKHMIIGSSRLAVFQRYRLSLHVGLIQTCYIVKIRSFGIFLNIYGFRALLHISEISNKRIKNINSLYKKGDQLTVKIIYIETDNGKVTVSLKRAKLSSPDNS